MHATGVLSGGDLLFAVTDIGTCLHMHVMYQYRFIHLFVTILNVFLYVLRAK